MSARGHNENAVRLSILADEAKQALGRVEAGEAETLEGWLYYGAVLNEGRSLFPGDREFGEWVEANALSQLGTGEVKRDDRIAAMWAAANSDQFEEARAAGKARTVRGIYAKWREIEAERERERLAEEKRQRAEAERAEASERAEKAKAEAAEKAEQETAAREAVETADEGSRQEAEQRAEKAAEERQQAERAAEEAAAAAQPQDEDPEEDADPYGYAKLSEGALLDTANGLRADLDEAKADLKTVKAERDQLKSEKDEIANATDLGPTVSKLTKQIATIKGTRDDALAEKARLQRQVNAQKAEIDKLKKSLERQEIAL